MEERLNAPGRVSAQEGGQVGNSREGLLAEVRDGVATVTLDRPAALNALNLAMLEGLAAWLDGWERDDRVRLVVLRGTGGKAFCAGGDIRELREMFVAGSGVHRHFFEVEYALDHRVHTYPKPVVAVMDGITMGGGMGLAQGATLRIAGPRTKVAMPETRIGFFPDVGATWFLQRSPGRIALYLGLAGIAIGAADSLYAGLVDACLSPDAIVSLETELPRVAAAADPRTALAELGRRLASPPARGELETLRPAIDLHFGRESVAAIFASLAAEQRPEFQPWAAKTLRLLEESSPTLLRVAFQQLRSGRSLGLADCFRLELNLIHGCFAQGDFVEGIRALIVDKDNSPRWNPPSLPEVTDASVAAFFAPRWSPSEHPLRHLRNSRRNA
ncbi:MAG TPA: enoyl-CoA hydratase/isomerase family protein [Usitatibacteraceae bacterium]|nr:enoyl-CoA hydratase/isomerase family protein [Usitatibacteraceae bacterium]